MSKLVNKLIEELKLIPEVEAIAIGGSRATNNFDPKSDYDVYLYCTGSIDENIRHICIGIVPTIFLP